MDKFLNLIVHSNLINFAIFLLIIILVAKKIDISAVLSKMRKSVVDAVKASSAAKEASKQTLNKAQNDLANSDIEVKKILETADIYSENLKDEIINAAKKKKNSIELNAQKAVENEERVLSNIITSKFGVESVDLAENKIVERVKKDVKLQEKFIDISLDEFERAALWIYLKFQKFMRIR